MKAGNFRTQETDNDKTGQDKKEYIYNQKTLDKTGQDKKEYVYNQKTLDKTRKNIFITRKLWNRKFTFRLMLCNNIKYTIQYCFNVVFLFHSFLLITVGRN